MSEYQELLNLSSNERYNIAMLLLNSLKPDFNVVHPSDSINQDDTSIPSSEILALLNEVMDEYTSEGAATNKQKYHSAGGFEALDKIEYRLKKRYRLG